ncbi:MAG: hypothetical protein PVH21_12925 [Myxococcales bacterium]|jgi:hypothetical protein
MGRFVTGLCSLLLVVAGCDSAACGDGFMQVAGQCIDPDAPGDCGEPCGTHEFCDASAIPNVCKCVPGYSGDPCTWSGVIEDPGFQVELGASSPWESARGTPNVLPLAPEERASGGTVLDLGEAQFAPSVICSAGTLAQGLQMPSYGLAEPLAVEVAYLARGVRGAAVGFNRAWKRLGPTGPAYKVETFCAGEAAYGTAPKGGLVILALSASERLPDCLGDDPGGDIRIDRIRIVPASTGQCPAPGQVINGSARMNQGGWEFEVEGDATGALEPDVGREGTSGARLARDAESVGRAAMTTKVSVPLPSSLASPALVFWWKGSAGRLFQATIGTFAGMDDPGRNVDTLVGTNAGLNNIYCLPPWTHGSVVDLSFFLDGDSTPSAEELVVDDVSIVSDPDCGSAADLLDAGFESAPNRWMGSALGSTSETVIMQEQSTLAHDGTGVLELRYWTSGAHVEAEQYVFVPEAQSGEGPAVRFYSRSPAEPSVPIRWVVGRDELVGPVATSSDWSINEACLPLQWAGRWFRFAVSAGSSESPGVSIAEESVFVDDFSLTTSPSCPANP